MKGGAYVGRTARTIAVSSDAGWLYVVMYGDSELAVVRTQDMQKVADVKGDSYPVGICVSPNGREVWLTSQGQKGQGGQPVSVFAVILGNPRRPVQVANFGSERSADGRFEAARSPRIALGFIARSELRKARWTIEV